MVSINFPEMFQTYKTNLVENRDAVEQNLILLLKSTKSSLFGDPYYGTNIKKLLFNQNDSVLVDILIDDIYVAILDFMPQIIVQRKDIVITSYKQDIFVEINCINRQDMTLNLYSIKLTDT